MAFLKRLGFYLFGLAIGLIFLAVFLRKKSAETGVEFCYLPNCRTLKDIRSKPLGYSDEIVALMEADRLDSTEIKDLLSNGNVDFKRSDTKSVPCKTYFIENDKGIFEIRNCAKKALLVGFSTKQIP